MSHIPLLNEKDFKDILDGMVDGVITIDQNGIVLSFNKTAETMFGYNASEVIGNNVSMLMPEPDRSVHDFYINKHVTTGEQQIIGIGRNVVALRKNGETFPMHLSVNEYPAKIEGDRWYISSCRDISLQKQQEEQLNRSQKMETIGKLTSGIAHDYNNMLGIILGYSELLSEKASKYPELTTYIANIKEATNRASNLTTQLLSITRKRSDSTKNILINNVLENNRQILSKTLTAKINVNIKTSEDLWLINIDEGALEDAILNLSINAMHAMPEGGELDITTSNIEINSLDAQVLNIVQGDYVNLSISDTGIGMTDDIISHIFEPFYSTKGESGTGLGLSQVFNFVSHAKGSIKVYSEIGQGTRFSIYFPRSFDNSSNTTKAESDEQLSTNLNGTASILIVDDENEMVKITSEILTSHGYKIFSAPNAAQAISLLQKETIDLVFSDVIMPDMDGFELAHIIRYTHPDIKIQLCSGFEKPKGKSVTNEALSRKILTKPFTSKQLLTSIQETLNY